MRIFKSAIITSILMLVITNTVLASPIYCPDVSVIQSNVAEQDSKIITRCNNDLCTLELPSPIYTWDDDNGFDSHWYFFMNLPANSPDEAKNKALDALNSLVYKSGPTYESRNIYICRYTNSAGFEAKTAAAS